ncbi:MAG: hypothetical protein BGO98_04960 [Myxococcales bacterium 68-20]|nr:hypothetical protein [Myxococcales bacterium]OJY16166.1 MAG: hypothetical protein BGO98_04960 [Myxococcales bacterium 68-20]
MPSKLEPDSLDPLTADAAKTDERPVVVAKAEEASASSSTKAEPARSRKGVVAALLAAAALAGVFMFMRGQSTPPPAPETTQRTPAVDEAPKAAATAAPTEEPSAAGPSAEEPAPAAEETPATAPATSGARPAAVAKGKPAAQGPAPAATLTESALEASKGSAAGDLGDAMRGAVGPREQAEDKATEKPTGPNAAQVRPSPGAVVGALGTVLPEARACLGADDTVRRGLIVFKSDGTVARVDIKGSKPEDDCVRTALSKAKVAPFVDETFSTPVTVRP